MSRDWIRENHELTILWSLLRSNSIARHYRRVGLSSAASDQPFFRFGVSLRFLAFRLPRSYNLPRLLPYPTVHRSMQQNEYQPDFQPSSLLKSIGGMWRGTFSGQRGPDRIPDGYAIIPSVSLFPLCDKSLCYLLAS